jgi:hypothetical protein
MELGGKGNVNGKHDQRMDAEGSRAYILVGTVVEKSSKEVPKGWNPGKRELRQCRPSSQRVDGGTEEAKQAKRRVEKRARAQPSVGST